MVSAPATTDTIANRNLLRESQNTVARLLPDVAGTYTLRLTVNDGAMACTGPFLALPTLRGRLGYWSCEGVDGRA